MSEQRGKTIKFDAPPPGEPVEMLLDEFLEAMPDEALMAAVEISFSILAERRGCDVGAVLVDFLNSMVDATLYERRN